MKVIGALSLLYASANAANILVQFKDKNSCTRKTYRNASFAGTLFKSTAEWEGAHAVVKSQHAAYIANELDVLHELKFNVCTSTNFKDHVTTEWVLVVEDKFYNNEVKFLRLQPQSYTAALMTTMDGTPHASEYTFQFAFDSNNNFIFAVNNAQVDRFSIVTEDRFLRECGATPNKNFSTYSFIELDATNNLTVLGVFHKTPFTFGNSETPVWPNQNPKGAVTESHQCLGVTLTDPSSSVSNPLTSIVYISAADPKEVCKTHYKTSGGYDAACAILAPGVDGSNGDGVERLSVGISAALVAAAALIRM